MPARATLIANPAAGHGRGARVLPAVADALREAGLEVEVVRTERPGHGCELAARAVEGDARLLLALGGDGTLNEVVSGVLATGAAPDELVVGPVPAGTGNSFVADFGLSPRNLHESIRRIASGQTRSIDAARITYQADGVSQVRYFVNVFGIGFMAQVADATNRRFKALGNLSYSVAVFWRLLALGAPRTQLELSGDGAMALDEPMTLVAVCNSQWTGNDMWLAPQAEPSDGQLDVVTLGPISRLELVRVFPRIFKGTHLSLPAVKVARATRIVLAPETPSPLLADGEVFGSTPATIEVLPGALRMAV